MKDLVIEAGLEASNFSESTVLEVAPAQESVDRILNSSHTASESEIDEAFKKVFDESNDMVDKDIDEIRKKEMLHQTERVVLSSIPSLHQSISSQEAYVIPQPDQYRTSIPHFFPFPFQVQNIPFAFRMPIPILALEVLTPLSSAAILPHPGISERHSWVLGLMFRFVAKVAQLGMFRCQAKNQILPHCNTLMLARGSNLLVKD
ncbi:hypothetical protein BD560DRAFT_421013 [Blakeslea trispora]|nr:hypothetical protein BD560DRAFT_421013 [Blakeslea trispora]